MKINIHNSKEFVRITKAPYSEVVRALLENTSIIKATKYMAPDLIVRAVRRSFKAYGRKHRKGSNVEVILTIGRPNYAEREFIKDCKKAGEPFPVKKVQFKLVNPKKPDAKITKKTKARVSRG